MAHRSQLRIVLLACGLVAGIPVPAYAYIDPGAGSYITQIVVAFVVMAVFVLRQMAWQLRTFLQRFARRKNPTE